jgi:hypothetical protein
MDTFSIPSAALLHRTQLTKRRLPVPPRAARSSRSKRPLVSLSRQLPP